MGTRAIKYFFFLSCTICFNAGKVVGQENNLVSSIKLLKTSFSIDRITSVDCDQFYNEFYEIDTFYITDKTGQQQILRYIHDSKSTEIYSGPDTRGKMYIYYKSGKTDSLCFGSTEVFSLNGTPMLLPDHQLIFMLDTLKNGHPRVITKEEAIEYRKEDSIFHLGDSVRNIQDSISHQTYEREQDSLLKNPLHCYFMELVLENKEITSFLGIDMHHFEKATIMNGDLYFKNCTFEGKYNKIKFIKTPDLEQRDSYRPFCYITYFGWNQWEKGTYYMLIYNDEEKSVGITFKIDKEKWIIGHYEHYARDR